jgi:hypothetical protein
VFAFVIALFQMDRLDVSLEDVVLRKGLPALVTLKVSVLEMDRKDVSL